MSLTNPTTEEALNEAANLIELELAGGSHAPVRGTSYWIKFNNPGTVTPAAYWQPFHGIIITALNLVNMNNSIVVAKAPMAQQIVQAMTTGTVIAGSVLYENDGTLPATQFITGFRFAVAALEKIFVNTNSVGNGSITFYYEDDVAPMPVLRNPPPHPRHIRP